MSLTFSVILSLWIKSQYRHQGKLDNDIRSDRAAEEELSWTLWNELRSVCKAVCLARSDGGDDQAEARVPSEVARVERRNLSASGER